MAEEIIPYLYLMLLRSRKQREQRLRALQKRQRRRHRLVMATIFATSELVWMVCMRKKGFGVYERAIRNRPTSRSWCDGFVSDENRKKFRVPVSRNTFEYLCGQLSSDVQSTDTDTGKVLTVEKKVGMTLWRLSTNCDLETIGNLFGVDAATVSQTVIEVCTTIVDLLKEVHLKRPSDEDFIAIMNDFHESYQVPQCVGAIDGSHVPISCPKEYETEYYNRKGFHSVIVQGTVDAAYKFWDVCIGWPGSVNYKRVLRNSNLFRSAEANLIFSSQSRQINGVSVYPFLIGNGAYPLKSWLMKPFSNAGELSRQQATFNYRIGRARGVVETAFARLKARWRCLNEDMDGDIADINLMIMACCILHNVCETFADPVNDAEVRELAERERGFGMMAGGWVENDGAAVRDALVHFFQ